MERKRYIHSSKINTVRQTVSAVMAAFAIFASISLVSCVKDELYDTPHPDKGALVLDADGLPGGDGYMVDIDGQTFEMTGNTFAVPGLFEPGTHTLTVYNRPEGFSVEGLVARVAPLEAAARSTGGLIHPLPGYLHSGTRQIEVTADDSLKVEMSVSQRVRDLRLELTVTEGDPERIASVKGTISGVAGAFDLAARKTTDEPASTAVAFARTGDKLTADARLLGFIGETPVLTVEIRFTDGRTQTVEDESFADAVKDFNKDMAEPLVLTGSLNTPTEAGMSATIENWQPGNAGGEDVGIR